MRAELYFCVRHIKHQQIIQWLLKSVSLGRGFASMFCSFAILWSKVIKVINVYLELTQICAIPSCKTTTDKKYTSLEVKDGWGSLISEMSLSGGSGHSAVIPSHSGSPSSALRPHHHFYLRLSLWKLPKKTKKEQRGCFYLSEPVYEIGLVINRM